MSAQLEVYFDYRSPFAYLLSEVLPEIAAQQGAEIEWKPIDLLGLSSFSGGLPYSEKKRAYVFVDAARQAEFHGVAIRPPEPFPVESELALRVALVAAGQPGFADAHRALFQAAWCDRRDLSSADVVADCLRAGGLDAEACLAEARSEPGAERLRQRTRSADDAGVFGVPTVSLAGELFWGLDALPILEWRLAGAGASGWDGRTETCPD